MSARAEWSKTMEITCPNCHITVDYSARQFHASSEQMQKLCEGPGAHKLPSNCPWLQEEAHRVAGRPINPLVL
jgi:hypothetical protein